MLLMHRFCTLHKHILGRHKKRCHQQKRSERNLVRLGWCKSLLWKRRFQNLQILPAFARHYSNTKMNFLKRFSSDKMTVPRSTSYGVYISQLIRFARASSYVADFNTRNKLLTQKLLKQGYRYHKLRKTFSKFYRRYYDLISKFQVGLKSLLRQGLSEPDFYGDLVYKLKKIVGSNNFSVQFIKIISHYKKIGYNINVLQQTASLVVNPITVGNFAFLFNCTPVGRTSDSMMVPT